MGVQGEATRRVERLGRRYAIGIRATTLLPIAVVAVLSADGPAVRLAAIVAVVVLVVWSVGYGVMVERGAATAAGVLDAVVLCALGVLTAQVTSASWLAESRSWIRPFVMFAAVGYQYSIRWKVGVPLGLAVVTTTVLTTAVVQGRPIGPDVVVTIVWSNLVPMLARLLFSLLTKAAERADVTVAEADTMRREQVVAEQVRLGQREISDSLHDTAATTLLMVAMGQVGESRALLRERARHDLDTIQAFRSGSRTEQSDLGSALRDVTVRASLSVDVDQRAEILLPPQVVRAVADATGEALTNVARHAGVDAAVLRIDRAGDGIVVEIADRGRGFERSLVPPTRRGLRASITARMAAVGGDATIVSAPGAGTTVRLEWRP
ncbi:sensor histidine kinase [Pseudonocardia pini]|uniref:sensor histidine kinase n=1 Tax=Pseudonocardia pini TaxID=2758030 RepID=UPI0015F0D6EB|nr:ATP-binding protein [Pseudonocardia pini]